MSATEIAYRFLRSGIVQGRFRPGARLPEEEVAEQAGVSRTPAREALRRLALEGFVEVSPNRGARVIDWDENDVINVFQIRAQLEPLAASLAATHRTDEELEELSDLCERMFQLVRDASFDELADHNARFHEVLLQASDNPQLLQVARPLLLRPLALRVYRFYDEQAVRRALTYHREITDAVAAQAPQWAQVTMLGHIRASEALLRNSLRADDESVEQDVATLAARIERLGAGSNGSDGSNMSNGSDGSEHEERVS